MNNQNTIEVFDRALLRLRRDRAALRAADYDFLLRDVADRLMDRMDVIRRPFARVLDMGSYHGVLAQKICARAGTETVFACDLSPRMAAAVPAPVMAAAADEEYLPFAAQSFDAVVSNLSLHWVNDLPGALLQLRRALRPDGLFMAAVLGGESLRELRDCLMTAEVNVTGGASPRVSPFIDLRDMGALLQRGGFALPVVDSDMITVDYSHPIKLMQDLRGMGASNAVFQRLKVPTQRRVIMEAARIYQEKYGDENGRVPATFQVIYAIGWSPHESQQQPLKPGSAVVRLADMLKTEEIKTDDTAKP